MQCCSVQWNRVILNNVLTALECILAFITHVHEQSRASQSRPLRLGCSNPVKAAQLLEWKLHPWTHWSLYSDSICLHKIQPALIPSVEDNSAITLISTNVLFIWTFKEIFTNMQLSKIYSVKWRLFVQASILKVCYSITLLSVKGPTNPRLSVMGFNSLWPRGAIWRHRSGSAWVQVMVCCLTAPRHYLNQCWLEIVGIHPSVI